MMNLNEINLKEFLSRSTDKESGLFKCFELLPTLSKDHTWLAGGAIRRAIQGEACDASDFDMFFRDAEAMNRAIEQLKNLGYLESKKNEFNSLWLKDNMKVQLIHFQYYASVNDLLDSFDFTICQLATDGETLFYAPMALWDIARKRLVLHRLSYGVATVRRLLKYQTQKYYACAGCLTKILESISLHPETIQSNVQYLD